MKRRLEKYREKSGMQTYFTELLRGVKDFADENLGKKSVITKGRLDADPTQSYWYVDVEDLEEC